MILYHFSGSHPTLRVHAKPECVIGARLLGHDIRDRGADPAWFLNQQYAGGCEQLFCFVCKERI